jgi:hypothetical protein
MMEKVTIPARLCTCDVCGYGPWYSIAKKKPEACPNRKCRSREWNGAKGRPKGVQAINLPKPATRAIKRQPVAFDEEF